jgi:glycogen(starch) synthase
MFTWEFPPQIVGGLGTYTYELSHQLKKLENNVSIFTMNDGAHKTYELMNGVEVHRPRLIDVSDTLPEFEADEIRRSGTATNFFSNIIVYNLLVSSKIVNDLIPIEKISFDILSVHDWLSAMSGITLKKATKLPMVFHLHSTEKGRSLGDGSKIINDLEKKTALVADKIITVSYAMREELISYGYPIDKIEVIWNGVDPQKYSPACVTAQKHQQIRTQYGISNDEKMILFLGRLTAVKGVDRLLMAMPLILSKYPKTKLVVVGRGELEGELVKLALDLGVKDKVIFNFNMLSEPERIATYAAADLAVFPSLYEPFGIVALEAMAMEKPLVVGARGVSGLREIVVSSGKDQCGYHINPYDPNDIAWGVNNLLEDDDRLQTFGKRGRARVLSEFTWSTVANNVLKVYSKAIDQKA